MTSTLGFSMIEDKNIEDIKNNKEEGKERRRDGLLSNTRKNKTVKNREPMSNSKAQKFLNSLKPSEGYSNHNDDDDDDNGLSDYDPLSNKEKSLNKKREEVEEEQMLNMGLKQQESFLSKQENFQRMHQERKDNLTPYLSELRNEYSDYYNSGNTSPNQENNVMQPESDLMKKLNYVVHMLEEQQDEKTQTITEELILYTFLGIFVIFVVDSFSKVTKYKR